MCGSQWPNVPISINTCSDIIPFVSRSLIFKHAGIFLCLSFLDLALKRQSGELYAIVNSIKVISLALTVTMSGWAEVSRISAGMVDGELSVALNPSSLSPSWRYSLRPLAKIFKALSVARYTFLGRVGRVSDPSIRAGTFPTYTVVSRK